MGSTTDNTARKPWIMNAFAMTAPGHLAPGTSKLPCTQSMVLYILLNVSKDSGDIQLKKSKPSTTGSAWQNSSTPMVFTASSSPTS